MTGAALPPVDLSLAEVLAAFTFASDLAFGLELEDGLKSCYIADRTAEVMGLSRDERITVYYAALLKDAGCTCWNAPMAQLWQTQNEIEARREMMTFGAADSLRGYLSWMRRYVGPELGPIQRLLRAADVFRQGGAMVREGFANAAEVCGRVSRRLELPASVADATLNMFEQWDGEGRPRGLAGEAIPVASRVVLPTFLLAPTHRVGGRDAARKLALAQRGKLFAPVVVDALLELMDRDDFWQELESSQVQQLVLEREPDCQFRELDESAFERVALAFADFADLKSPIASAHSRRVGTLTRDIAAEMGRPPREIALFHCAALMHDLGLVVVPSAVLIKPEASWSESERELIRLHPYYGERILERVPSLAPIKTLVAAHHERMDGKGYYRGIEGKDIPLGARIIAVANRFDELTHDEPGRQGLSQQDAVAAIGAEAGDALDGEIVDALRACLGVAAARSGTSRALPAGLTSREAEVLRLACRGLTRKQIAGELIVSESTVRHHLEHIYNKTGTSTRVGAMLFAMENGLIE